jgi:hypothetical protein
MIVPTLQRGNAAPTLQRRVSFSVAAEMVGTQNRENSFFRTTSTHYKNHNIIQYINAQQATAGISARVCTNIF